MKKILLLLFFQFLLILGGCKNEVSIQLPAPMGEAGQVSGKIILYANTKIVTSGLEVLTGIGAVTSVNASYAIDTTGKTSTTLLMNKALPMVSGNFPATTSAGHLIKRGKRITLLYVRSLEI